MSSNNDGALSQEEIDSLLMGPDYEKDSDSTQKKHWCKDKSKKELRHLLKKLTKLSREYECTIEDLNKSNNKLYMENKICEKSIVHLAKAVTELKYELELKSDQ